MVSSIVASENRTAIQGLALLYPAFSLFDDAHNRFASISEIPETFNLMGLTVGSRYFTDIWDYDIYQKIADFQKTVTIFHGTADTLVAMSYEERAAETFPQATLTRLEGEGHGFSRNAQIQVAQQLLHFIKDNGQ